jgi:hypothetical protein
MQKFVYLWLNIFLANNVVVSAEQPHVHPDNIKNWKVTFKSRCTHTCEIIQTIDASGNVLTRRRITFIYIYLTHISYSEREKKTELK